MVFYCSECGLGYAEKTWSEKCREWCLKHKSCNLGIIKRAVFAPRVPK
ncbi:MAG TPA: hypothetical protein VJI71_01860 [Candidatus Norongarragalinales archaeon]|nr:hypothetical protein [Candidatus Norongarragalinales archaeon]